MMQEVVAILGRLEDIKTGIIAYRASHMGTPPDARHPPRAPRPDDRLSAIMDVALMIEDAMTSAEPVTVYDLAEEIVDRLQPPARPGLPLTAMREWQERFKACGAADANVIAIDRAKPRIRIRAATQHSA